MNRKQRKAKLAKARHHSGHQNNVLPFDPFNMSTVDFMKAAYQKPMLANAYMMYALEKYSQVRSEQRKKNIF